MYRNFLVVLTVALLFQFAAESHSVKADICVNSTLKVNYVQGYAVAVARGVEEPIPKAEVELKEFHNDEWQTKYKTTTDENGFFKIADVPSGKYEIHVLHPMIGSFGTIVRVKRNVDSKPSKEIIIVLEFMKCGEARVQKTKRK